MQRNAPARGAVGTGSVVVSAGSVASAAAAAGSVIPHAGAIRALVIPMIEAAFRTGADGDGGRRGPIAAAPPCDTPTSNTHGRDHTRRRSRRGGCSADRFSGEAACPRRRSGGALRLDTARKPWHKRDDWLGPSEHRGGHRGSGGYQLQALTSSRRSPQLTRRACAAQPAEAVDADAPVDAQDAPTACLQISLKNARFPQPPPPSSFLLETRRPKTALRRQRSRFTRFQVSADTGDCANSGAQKIQWNYCTICCTIPDIWRLARGIISNFFVLNAMT